MKIRLEPKSMEFLKPAKTSRGEYTQKTSYLLSLQDSNYTGWGEAAPLGDLSTDGKIDFQEILAHYWDAELTVTDIAEWLLRWEPGSSEALPSLRFALHSAWKNLTYQQSNGQVSQSSEIHWVDNAFTQGKRGMKINGLVWMNGIDAMYDEAMAKVAAGFRCVKLKVGALDFDEECKLIERIRKSHSAFSLELRLDANGGFRDDEALEHLTELQRFEIHSIEQPVMAGSEVLDKICRLSAIDVALDESLIGLHPSNRGVNELSGDALLTWAKPKYIILKPTLLGGTDLADLWIQLAQKHAIGWWSTSALEGNIGLATIAQWVSQYQPSLPQGLGTGLLFKDNFTPFTRVDGETLWYNKTGLCN